MTIIKRIFDFIFALLLLIILSPLMLIIAIIIKLESVGPIFFVQKRVGKDGKEFYIYKFRTLYNNNPNLHIDSKSIKNLDNFVFPSPKKEDITKIGRFLRKTSLNELPQLINILKGDMSFVGPRPEIPEIVALYTEEYKKRLKVKPGITGLAQIKGRGDLNKKTIISYDLKYIENWSLWLDFKILAKTLFVVLSTKGAK